jgi:hypothetical protein
MPWTAGLGGAERPPTTADVEDNNAEDAAMLPLGERGGDNTASAF